MDELVKRLRERSVFLFPHHGESRSYDADLMHEAADAIEELSEPRWIPVTERLIHSGWYLVACNEWGGSAVRKAIYDEATRKWLEFPCGGPKDITKFVTHYMPLPEPPKEEGE